MPEKRVNNFKQFTDPGNWRQSYANRPWYLFASRLIPNKKREKVLDLGAGNGEFAELLKKNNKEVFCLDISPIYVGNLQKRGFKSKQVDFNRKLPFKNSFLDGIVCLEVIEHITEAERLLREINRILKINGWLIVSTPNISWFGYRFLALIGKVPFKEGYHLRYFNYHWLKKKLSEAGFRRERESCFTPLPYINRLKQFWLPVRLYPNLFAQDLIFLCRKK